MHRIQCIVKNLFSLNSPNHTKLFADDLTRVTQTNVTAARLPRVIPEFRRQQPGAIQHKRIFSSPQPIARRAFARDGIFRISLMQAEGRAENTTTRRIARLFFRCLDELFVNIEIPKYTSSSSLHSLSPRLLKPSAGDFILKIACFSKHRTTIRAHRESRFLVLVKGEGGQSLHMRKTENARKLVWMFSRASKTAKRFVDFRVDVFISSTNCV